MLDLPIAAYQVVGGAYEGADCAEPFCRAIARVALGAGGVYGLPAAQPPAPAMIDRPVGSSRATCVNSSVVDFMLPPSGDDAKYSVRIPVVIPKPQAEHGAVVDMQRNGVENRCLEARAEEA